jgi:hypothetical protein
MLLMTFSVKVWISVMVCSNSSFKDNNTAALQILS